ncbi:MAG TPA: MBL fold metallo-hydrolase [Syntrophomonas sp.]|nr:MBL fold metallo-hydrolase [Syntrophomonas sp.]HRW12479.1 MBL fold metallo-hydrolase [Syntrophomonas sp.]
MRLVKINGNSYYIPAPANIGVFQFKDKYALLVDCGDNKQQARRIDEIIKEQKLSVKYIVNTHNHIDHCGGNGYFQERSPGLEILTSATEKQFIEDNHLFSNLLYGGQAPHELRRHFSKNPALTVTDTLVPGTCRINDEKFEIHSLPGHSPGQIGLATRDRVCYLGDALFSAEKLRKYSLPFLFDIAAQLETYQTLSRLEYDHFVLGHAETVYDQPQLLQLVDLNRSLLLESIELAREILSQPKTREELLEEISILRDLPLDFKEYYFSLSTVSAIITYLYDQKQLVYQVENGKLYYYTG